MVASSLQQALWRQRTPILGRAVAVGGGRGHTLLLLLLLRRRRLLLRLRVLLLRLLRLRLRRGRLGRRRGRGGRRGRGRGGRRGARGAALLRGLPLVGAGHQALCVRQRHRRRGLLRRCLLLHRKQNQASRPCQKLRRIPCKAGLLIWTLPCMQGTPHPSAQAEALKNCGRGA